MEVSISAIYLCTGNGRKLLGSKMHLIKKNWAILLKISFQYKIGCCIISFFKGLGISVTSLNLFSKFLLIGLCR